MSDKISIQIDCDKEQAQAIADYIRIGITEFDEADEYDDMERAADEFDEAADCLDPHYVGFVILNLEAPTTPITHITRNPILDIAETAKELRKHGD